MRGATTLIEGYLVTSEMSQRLQKINLFYLFVVYQLSNLGHMDGSDIRSAITLFGDNKLTKECEEVFFYRDDACMKRTAPIL